MLGQQYRAGANERALRALVRARLLRVVLVPQMLSQVLQVATLVVADVTSVDAVLVVGVSKPMLLHVAATRRCVSAEIALVHYRHLLFLYTRSSHPRRPDVLLTHVSREKRRRMCLKRADVTLEYLVRMRPLVVIAHASECQRRKRAVIAAEDLLLAVVRLTFDLEVALTLSAAEALALVVAVRSLLVMLDVSFELRQVGRAVAAQLTRVPRAVATVTQHVVTQGARMQGGVAALVTLELRVGVRAQVVLQLYLAGGRVVAHVAQELVVLVMQTLMRGVANDELATNTAQPLPIFKQLLRRRRRRRWLIRRFGCTCDVVVGLKSVQVSPVMRQIQL